MFMPYWKWILLEQTSLFQLSRTNGFQWWWWIWC
jgi:hypothetical protein